MLRNLTILCAVFMLGGCSYLNFFGDGSENEIVLVDGPLIDVEFVDSGRINDSKRLSQGGKMLISPFSAGADVEVNEEIDKISLRIIRGILDVYEHKWPEGASQEEFDVSNFDVGIAEDEAEADLRLYGRITEVYTSSSWKKWMLAKPKIRLSVEGWLADTRNRTTVLSFQDSIEFKEEETDHRDLAQEIGRHIGQFIFKNRN